MADLERGQRIKARRVELHLTQPAVVDLMETLAGKLPEDHPLHPAKAGKAPVTLRGLQTWEQGGGVAWEKAKLLAQALQTDARTLINGISDDAPTPTPFAGRDQTSDQLDRIEARQEAILERLDRLEAAISARTDALLPGVQELLEEAEAARSATPARSARTSS